MLTLSHEGGKGLVRASAPSLRHERPMWENCNACCGLPLGTLGLSANIGGARLVRILLHFRPVEAVAQSDRQPPHTSGAPIAVLVVEDNDELRSEIADL